MESTKQQLLQQILDDPTNNDVRLIYADWEEEYGSPLRAEFIRTQIELPKVGKCLSGYEICDYGSFERMITGGCSNCKRRGTLLGRQHQLFNSWEATGGFGLGDPVTACKESGGWHIKVEPTTTYEVRKEQDGPAYFEVQWTRGFVSRVAVPQETWLEYADVFVEHNPIQKVELIGKAIAVEGYRKKRWTWFIDFGNANNLHASYIHEKLAPSSGRRLYVFKTQTEGETALSNWCIEYGKTKLWNRQPPLKGEWSSSDVQLIRKVYPL